MLDYTLDSNDRKGYERLEDLIEISGLSAHDLLDFFTGVLGLCYMDSQEFNDYIDQDFEGLV